MSGPVFPTSTATSRRQPGPLPSLVQRISQLDQLAQGQMDDEQYQHMKQIIGSLREMAMLQDTLNGRLWALYNSFPAPHATTHLGGSDNLVSGALPKPLAPGIPGAAGAPQAGVSSANHVHDMGAFSFLIPLEELTIGADGAATNDSHLQGLMARIALELERAYLPFMELLQAVNALQAEAGTPLTTLGDLYGFGTAGARVPVGPSGYGLHANSSAALGVDYEQDPDPTLGLVSFFRFEEPSGYRYDSYGLNHLKPVGGVTQGAGKVGNGVVLDGSTGYLFVPNNPSLQMGGNVGFGIKGWTNQTAIFNSFPTVASKWELSLGNAGLEYALRWTQNGHLQFLVGNGGSTIGFAQTTNQSAGIGIPNYVEGWYDAVAQTINAQVNRGPIASVPWAGGSWNGTAPLVIGGSLNAGAPNLGTLFPGTLDAIGISRGQFNEAYRAGYWNAGNGREVVPAASAQPLQRTITVANNTATPILQVAIPTLVGAGGKIRYTARVQNGTDVQIESGEVTYAVGNKGGVYTAVINKVVIVGPPTQPSVALTAGTLAVTFTIVTGASLFNIDVNLNSSLGSITLEELDYDHVEHTSQAVTYF